jgi:hypothetical protein
MDVFSEEETPGLRPNGVKGPTMKKLGSEPMREKQRDG